MNPDKIIFITGVSTGIGLAAVKRFRSEKYTVYGIGRSFPKDLSPDKRLKLDLSDLSAIENFEFPEITEKTEIVLINNAGTLGEIARIDQQKEQKEADVIQLNLIAPMILCRKFIQQYRKQSLCIINISSGAGKRAISGWSAYCASKAGLDLFSETIQLEATEQDLQLRIHAFAPGVVDTAMQAKIRESDPEKFSSLDRFISLKEEGELRTPETVAGDLLTIVMNKNLSVILNPADL